MNDTPLQKTIEEAYASRETWKTNPPAAIIKAVNDALQALDEGRLRIASKSDDGSWQSASVAQTGDFAVLYGA